ncbi:crotonase/enoyl-CoA hydratase family protein [Lysobacter hankyongensis]|uniref:Crotonase/enoyl-CoA hydratase family protein n=1 Tax=Lysobacter hankyongensis TaxID=1176535 RepID=A0ABP9BSC6_9GAMM
MSNIQSVPDDGLMSFPISERYSAEHDASLHLLWSTWRACGKPCFSRELLQDMGYGVSTLIDGTSPASHALRYFVMRSRWDGVFTLGADLGYFQEMILTLDRDALMAYARQSADMMYALHSGFGKGVASIALVQGRCIGGGFEVAVACDYLFAERQSEFGFPEIQLGIFPGMGALPILARRLSRSDYEAVCHTGKTFSADELKAMGIVDVVVETGEGEGAVVDFVKKRHGAFRSHQAMADIRRRASPLSRADFHADLDAWVDIVMSLDRRRLALLSLAAQKQQTA